MLHSLPQPAERPGAVRQWARSVAGAEHHAPIRSTASAAGACAGRASICVRSRCRAEGKPVRWRRRWRPPRARRTPICRPSPDGGEPGPGARPCRSGCRVGPRQAVARRLVRQPAEERCSTLFPHRRQQRLQLPAVARQHRCDLGTVARYHADIIESDVLDPVKPVNQPELNIHFAPRALWRNELTDCPSRPDALTS